MIRHTNLSQIVYLVYSSLPSSVTSSNLGQPLKWVIINLHVASHMALCWSYLLVRIKGWNQRLFRLGWAALCLGYFHPIIENNQSTLALIELGLDLSPEKTLETVTNIAPQIHSQSNLSNRSCSLPVEQFSNHRAWPY